MTRLYATLIIALLISTATSSAQEASKWAGGVRGGWDIEIIGRYTGLGEVAGKPMYLEGRLGVPLFALLTPELVPEGTLIAAWECVKFGKSRVGDFSFDAGASVNAGGWSPTEFWITAGPMVRLDYTFNEAPISISLDWTPSIGLRHTPSRKVILIWHKVLYSHAIAVTYNF